MQTKMSILRFQVEVLAAVQSIADSVIWGLYTFSCEAFARSPLKMR
jgi:hypothetical protein